MSSGIPPDLSAAIHAFAGALSEHTRATKDAATAMDCAVRILANAVDKDPADMVACKDCALWARNNPNGERGCCSEKDYTHWHPIEGWKHRSTLRVPHFDNERGDCAGFSPRSGPAKRGEQ